MSLPAYNTDAHQPDAQRYSPKALILIASLLSNLVLTGALSTSLGTLLHLNPWYVASQFALSFAASTACLLGAFLSAVRGTRHVLVLQLLYHDCLFLAYFWLLIVDESHPARFLMSRELTEVLLLVSIQSPHYFLFVNMVESVGKGKPNVLRISVLTSGGYRQAMGRCCPSSQGSAEESHEMLFTNRSQTTLNDEEKALPEQE